MTFWSRNPRLRLPIHAAICTLTFAVSLPVAIALFPQESKVCFESTVMGDTVTFCDYLHVPTKLYSALPFSLYPSCIIFL